MKGKHLSVCISLFAFILLACQQPTAPPLLDMESIVEDGKVPKAAMLSAPQQEFLREVFAPYTPKTRIVTRYVVEGGKGNKDGSSWENAYDSVETALNIDPANSQPVYIILVAGGLYTPGSEMKMRKNTAIVGGWKIGGGWTRSPEDTTRFSGDDKRRVFNNKDLDKTAVLAFVTVQYAFSNENGGGMYNLKASPALIEVDFMENESTGDGGGIYNDESSPTLTRVSFLRNEAHNGGGIYNKSSSPAITQSTFARNRATFNGGRGGGIYNEGSAPQIRQTVFSKNFADSSGGGIANYARLHVGSSVRSSPYIIDASFLGNTAPSGGGMSNNQSSPTLVNVTFSGNTASMNNGGGIFDRQSVSTLIGVSFTDNMSNKLNGGGMAVNTDGRGGPLLVNTLFWGNTAPEGVGPQIYFDNDTLDKSGDEGMVFHYGIIQDGVGDLTSGNPEKSLGGGLGAQTRDPRKDIVITYSQILSGNPKIMLPAGDNGGFVSTTALGAESSAIDAGVHVRRYESEDDRSEIYFSTTEDDGSWKKLIFDETAKMWNMTDNQTPPERAVDLTADDARGYKRSGSPDIGSYEF